MRNLINWIRSCFCKHEFEFEENRYKKYGVDDKLIREGDKVSRTCKKCGWHKSYWKY